MMQTVVLIFLAFNPVLAPRISKVDDPPVSEALPPPQPMSTDTFLPSVIELPPMLPYERMDRYAVWQYVAPDRTGRFRPRVIYSPHGAYFLHNGAPYLYTATHTLDFMSYATD